MQVEHVKFDRIDGMALNEMFGMLEAAREAGRITMWFIQAGYDNGTQSLVCVDVNVPNGNKLDVRTISAETPNLLDSLWAVLCTLNEKGIV